MASLRIFSPRYLTACLFGFGLALGCNGSGSADAESDTATDSDSGSDSDGVELPEGCDAYIAAPGDDDQAALQGALIDAADGATVCVGEGTFHFNTEVTITKTGLTLRGAGADKTSLDFAEQDLGANGILITGDEVVLEHLKVVDSAGDGVRANDVSNITFRDMAVEWTADASVESGAYGLYPVGCTGVTIQRVWVKGARDAGIYVGQSTKVLVEDSEAYGNVAGIEIENTTDSTVRRNHAHDNTAGLLIFNLPGLPVKDGKRCNAYENIIENNNLPNFAEDGTIVSEVPYGVGAFILASDGNEFHNNTVRGNDSTGIAMVSYNLDLLPSYDDPAFDRYCQGNHVHDNTFEGNGTDPDVLALVLAGNMTPPLPDIVDDGCTDPDLMVMGDAMANCIGDNGGAAYFWAAMCGGSSSADPMEVGAACSHSSLPDVPE
ncbi:MAG: right-handed parallel beta-helix repeat-containing protein [Myxococcales bacterium]|nr:right-handed parallel beta-helix repeat-containing protein [Myxococcales bacterium]